MISKIKSMVLTLLLIVTGASHAAGVSNSPPSRTQSTVSIGAPSAPATGIDYRAINLGGWSTLYGYNGDTLGNVSAVSLGVNVNRGAFPSIPTYRSTGWATNFFMQSNESGNPQISLGVYPSGAAGAGLAAATSRLTLSTGSINLEGTVNVATNAVVNGSLDTWGFANLNGGTITTTLTASLAAGLNGGVTTTTLTASGAAALNGGVTTTTITASGAAALNDGATSTRPCVSGYARSGLNFCVRDQSGASGTPVFSGNINLSAACLAITRADFGFPASTTAILFDWQILLAASNVAGQAHSSGVLWTTNAGCVGGPLVAGASADTREYVATPAGTTLARFSGQFRAPFLTSTMYAIRQHEIANQGNIGATRITPMGYFD